MKRISLLLVLVLACSAIAQDKILNDGARSWYTSPETVVIGNDVLIGLWSGARNRPQISRFNLTSGEVTTVYLSPGTGFIHDDHCAPALASLASGKILCKFNHILDDSYSITSSAANDLNAWASTVTITTGQTEGYSNLWQTTTDRVIDFFRRVDGTSTVHNFRYTDDDGATWSAGTAWCQETGERPYARFHATSASRIDFAIGDGHPGEISVNMYHGYILVDGSNALTFYKTDGTLVGDEGDMPFAPSDFTKVFDATSDDYWVMDLVVYGSPVSYVPAVLATRFVARDTSAGHECWRGLWGGSSWSTEKVADFGTTATADSPAAAAPQYNGGCCLDKGSYDTVAIGREYGAGDLRMELFEKSGTWSKTADLSGDTSSENMRPFCVRKNGVTRYFWMQGTYTLYSNFDMGIATYPEVTYRTAKPATPVLNAPYIHPGAVLYLPPQESSGAPADLMGNYTPAVVGTAVADGDGSLGKYLSGFTTSDYITFDSLAANWAAAAHPKWIAVLFSNTGTGSQALVSLGNSGTTTPFYSLFLNNGAVGRVSSNNHDDATGSVNLNSGATTCNNGDPHVLMAVHGAANLHTVFYDGVQQAFSTTTLGTATLDRASLGVFRRTAVANATSANIYAVALGYGAAPAPDELYLDWSSGRFSGTVASTLLRVLLEQQASLRRPDQLHILRESPIALAP